MRVVTTNGGRINSRLIPLRGTPSCTASGRRCTAKECSGSTQLPAGTLTSSVMSTVWSSRPIRSSIALILPRHILSSFWDPTQTHYLTAETRLGLFLAKHGQVGMQAHSMKPTRLRKTSLASTLITNSQRSLSTSKAHTKKSTNREKCKCQMVDS